MSTSSCLKSNSNRACDIRYLPKYCYCGKKAAIRIVVADKETKGKLFCNCSNHVCKFFRRYEPSSVFVQVQPRESDDDNDVSSGILDMGNKMQNNNGKKMDQGVMIFVLICVACIAFYVATKMVGSY